MIAIFLRIKKFWLNKNLPDNIHYKHVFQSQKPFLVSESRIFRNTKPNPYIRLGWYSYQWDEGIFGAKNCPRDRWLKFEKSGSIGTLKLNR